MKLAKDKVSFKIRLAAFQARGGTETYVNNQRAYCPAGATFSGRCLRKSLKRVNRTFFGRMGNTNEKRKKYGSNINFYRRRCQH
jgi:hypothetical protein